MADVYKLAEQVAAGLGVSPDLIYGQWYHESSGFSSRLAKENNNFGGYTQEEPNGEDNKQPDGGNYYMYFDSPEAFANHAAGQLPKFLKGRRPQTPEDLAAILWDEGYYRDAAKDRETDIADYANGIRNGIGHRGDGAFFLPGVNTARNAYGALPPEVPETPPEPLGFGGFMRDQFVNSWTDSLLGGVFRSAFSRSWEGRQEDFRITQADINYVTKALPGNPAAQRWVLMNAADPEHMLKLIAMKQEDERRQQRIELYQGNWAEKAAGFASAGAGALLSDPTILLPLGQEAFLGKALGRLGGAAAKVSTSKLLKYAELAATNAAVNVVERKTAEIGGGYQQDYGAAALVGGLAGGMLGALGDGFRATARNRGSRKVLAAVDNADTHAVTKALDLPLPNEIPKIRGEIEQIADKDFAKRSPSKTLASLIDSGKVYAVARADLTKLATKLGVELPENPKAFHKLDERLTVIVKDAIKSEDDVEGLLAHEIGVHGNLKESLGEKTYGSIKNAVEERIANPPDDAWLNAIKATPSGGWEDVLGHWVETNWGKSDPLFAQLKKGANKILKATGRDTKPTDDELRDFIKKSLMNEAENSKGYRTLPDGAVIMNGLKFSAANVFNPNLISHMIDIEKPARNPAKRLANAVSRWTEAGWFYGTPFGILTHSPTKHLRQWAEDVLADARMREYDGAGPIPIEKQKEFIRKRLDVHWANYMQTRTDYLYDTLTTEGLPTSARMQDFNKAVRECYNATYTDNVAGLAKREWDPKVIEGAKQIKALRDEMIEIAKSSAEMFGYKTRNLIEKDWEPLDAELWRRLDMDKWQGFVKRFPTLQKATEYLTDYAKAAAKRDKVYKKLLDEKTQEYQKALEAWEDTVKNLKEGEKKPRRPNKPKVTEAEVDKWVNEKARDWAFGIVDQDLSNLDRFKGGKDPGLSNPLDWLNERFPMDTSKVLQAPWGEFSYDIHLRSDDLDHMVPRTINRFSGEAALRNKYRDTQAMIHDIGKARQALEHGVTHKQIDKATADRNMEAMEEALLQIRGLRRDRDVQNKWNALASLLKGQAYVQNGANMGANQLGELGGAMAYVGLKTVLHFVPAFARSLRDIRAGKGTGEFVQDAEKHLFGANLESIIWQSDYASRVWKDASVQGSLFQRLDAVNNYTTIAGRMVSTISGLPKLTEAMLRGIRQDTLVDTLKWAGGAKFSPLRNPFSESKLKAAGITDSAVVDQIKSDINKYLAGKKVEGLDAWMKESPETFWRFRQIIDNQSMRALQQHTVGNKNLLADASPFKRVFFQFKDFSLKVMNGQFTRILTHREIDDCMALAYSMMTNAMVYAGLTYGRAWAYYGDNEAKREKYLEDRLNFEALATAAFLRSNIGTGLSFARDAYEAYTGADTYRTTVERRGGDRGKERDWGDRIGDTIAQLPAVRAATDVGEAGEAAAKLAFTEKATQRDLKALFRLLPLQNWIPMVKLSEQLMDDSGLPEKPYKRR